MSRCSHRLYTIWENKEMKEYQKLKPEANLDHDKRGTEESRKPSDGQWQEGDHAKLGST